MITGYCYKLYCTTANGETLVESSCIPESKRNANSDMICSPVEYMRSLLYYYVDLENPTSDTWRCELSECEFDVDSDEDIDDDFDGAPLNERYICGGEMSEEEVAEHFSSED